MESWTLEQQETEEHTSVQSFISNVMQPGQLENYIYNEILLVKTNCRHYSQTGFTVVAPQETQ